MMKLFLMNFPMIFYIILITLMMMPLKSSKIHPLYYMILIISITFIITLFMNMISKSWMSFIMFLIMIGGLMIIFLYITSINNNKLLYFNNIMNFMKVLKSIIMNMLIIFLMFNLINYFNNQELMNNSFNLFEEFNEYNLSKLFNYNKMMLMIIMIYLLISMICIMNICYKFNSPIRQMYYYE